MTNTDLPTVHVPVATLLWLVQGTAIADRLIGNLFTLSLLTPAERVALEALREELQKPAPKAKRKPATRKVRR